MTAYRANSPSEEVLDPYSPEYLKLRRNILLTPKEEPKKPIKKYPKLDQIGWIDRWLCDRLMKHVCNQFVSGCDNVNFVDKVYLYHHLLLKFQKCGWTVVWQPRQLSRTSYSESYNGDLIKSLLEELDLPETDDRMMYIGIELDNKKICAYF